MLSTGLRAPAEGGGGQSGYACATHPLIPHIAFRACGVCFICGLEIRFRHLRNSDLQEISNSGRASFGCFTCIQFQQIPLDRSVLSVVREHSVHSMHSVSAFNRSEWRFVIQCILSLGGASNVFSPFSHSVELLRHEVLAVVPPEHWIAFSRVPCNQCARSR